MKVYGKKLSKYEDAYEIIEAGDVIAFYYAQTKTRKNPSNKPLVSYYKVKKKEHGGLLIKYIHGNKGMHSDEDDFDENWQWKVENEFSGDALFLQPNGKRITEKYLRSHLSKAGKKIAGNWFYPYIMRHTFATYLFQCTKNLKFVSMMLGHTKTSNTDKYVHIAECMERQLKGNLFNMALKPHNFGYVGEKPKKPKNDL
jgi:integrase